MAGMKNEKIVRLGNCPNGVCFEMDCDFYINDIRFGNCALKVDREMNIDEIAVAMNIDRREVLGILRSALHKIRLLWAFVDKNEKEVMD
jgi:hypothetical protein